MTLPPHAARQRAANRAAAETTMSIYRKLGVELFVNCGFSRSFYGNSTPSEGVRAAMDSAARDHVLMAELAEAAGRRLAELTGAEWGMVASGSAGGLTLAAAACVAANDPLRMLRLPASFDGHERVVLMPAGQRFAYDQGVRVVGARIEEVAGAEALKAALATRNVVAILVFGERDAEAPLPFDALLPHARQAGVPVIVDAASEFLGHPESWTARGADLVVYSVGKRMRGPAATGLLLGREALVRAAWCNSPPNQSFGRMMKISKEQIVGAVTAVEEWFARDHAAEERRWDEMLDRLQERLRAVDGVALEIRGALASTLRLRVDWSARQPNLTYLALRDRLLARRPRILIDDYGADTHSTLISPFALRDGEVDLVADALIEAFTAHHPDPRPAAVLPLDPGGKWALTIDFANGPATHGLALSRQGDDLSGTHLTPFGDAPAHGAMTAGGFEVQSLHLVEGNTASFRFVAEECAPDRLSGFVEMGAAASHTRGPTTFSQFGRVAFVATRTG